MIKKIGVINEKNIKRLLSSKLSIVSIVVGPLLMILLLGVAFGNHSFSGIGIGLHSESSSPIAFTLANMLEVEDFKLISFQDKIDCINSAMSGSTALCLSIGEDNKLDFYIDYSRLSLASNVLFSISSKIDVITKSLSLSTTEDLLSFLRTSSEQIQSSMGNIDLMLSNLDSLQQSLNLINSELSKFDISDNLGLLQQINDPNSDLKKNLDIAKSDIDLLIKRLDFAISELNGLNSLISNSANNIDQAFNGLNCASSGFDDFTEFLQTGGFFEAISRSSAPECSLIYTLKVNFDNRKFEIDNTIKDFEEVKLRAQSTKREIDKMESTILSQTLKLEGDLESADSSRVELQDTIRELENSSNSGEEQIELIKTNLESLSSALFELSSIDPENIVSPITSTFDQLDDIERSYLDYLFPGLMLLIIMFVSILLGSILIMKEKVSTANFRNQIMPLPKFIFLIGTYFTSLIFVLMQVIIFLTIGFFIFKSNIYIDFLLILEIFIASIVFISIGIIVSNLSKSEEVAILTAISLCILMLMFSNLLIPVETMTFILSKIASLSPFNLFELVLRRHMIYNLDILTLPITTLISIGAQSIFFIGFAYYTYIKKN
jgi:ABC-type multidrug transport system permease subunit